MLLVCSAHMDHRNRVTHAHTPPRALSYCSFCPMEILPITWHHSNSLFFFKIFFFYVDLFFHVFIVFYNTILQCNITILLLFYVLVFWTPGMWDLSLPTRGRTQVPCLGRRILNHWITREAPYSLFFNGT